MNEDVVLSAEQVENMILLVRGQKVILDRDLAKLYGVTTGNLNKAVKRNIDRFPNDFMFQLTTEEYKSLRFRFGIFKKGQHSKYLPYAFTEQRIEGHDEQIQTIFEVIRQLMAPPYKPKRKIGYTVKEKQKAYVQRSKKNTPSIEGSFTPKAKKIWETIAGDIQIKILNNVWCVNCRKESSMGQPDRQDRVWNASFTWHLHEMRRRCGSGYRK